MCNVTVYCGMCREIVECVGILWNVSVYCGMCRYIVECVGMLWNVSWLYFKHCASVCIRAPAQRVLLTDVCGIFGILCTVAGCLWDVRYILDCVGMLWNVSVYCGMFRYVVECLMVVF